jgi:hypothetical protein
LGGLKQRAPRTRCARRSERLDPWKSTKDTRKDRVQTGSGSVAGGRLRVLPNCAIMVESSDCLPLRLSPPGMLREANPLGRYLAKKFHSML